LVATALGLAVLAAQAGPRTAPAKKAAPQKGITADVAPQKAPRSPYARAAQAESEAQSGAVTQMQKQGLPATIRKSSALAAGVGNGRKGHGAR
jgi:hypothetical protein